VDGLRVTVRADEKVFIKGKMLIGFCGSFRMRDLIRYSFEIPKHARKIPVEEYMATTFLNALRKTLVDGGHTEKKDNVETFEGNLLIAYRQRLFEIEGDFQVGEPRLPFHAIGCGDDIAFGSLFTSKKDTPKRRITTALSAAVERSAGVRRPFTILQAPR
jgi:ATP-dependent protease HslVU (ClpYQ) peptidase subunit